VFLVSTPTIRGLSRIEREFEASDQRRYFVACPHCGESQWLKFERLRWEKGRPETAAYACEGCDAAIAEHQDGDAGSGRMAGDGDLGRSRDDRLPPLGALFAGGLAQLGADRAIVGGSARVKGGGGGGGTEVTEYFYFASFAVALCEGPITGIGRIWADGKIMSRDGVTLRLHKGGEEQEPDPFIASKMGAANTPAYRGTAYVVFEELPLERFGNRLPQLSFEVFRPLAEPDTAEGLVRAVTLIPASGEFAYATHGIRKGASGETAAENLNALEHETDLVVALDRLQASAPRVESVSLVVAWFGDDLRAGHCQVRPAVEVAAKATSPRAWVVNGVERGAAHVVSTDVEGRPIYGGTPADFAVVQAIQELKARGFRVTFYPFILMDVPAGNDLPDPHSDHAATLGQPTFPWRGRITCSPAAGYPGSVDKTVSAGSQVAALFGSAQPSDFAVSGESVSWTGPSDDWGLRRMILHYAHLCAAASGVDAFLIGSEMRGLTTIRDGAASYPSVAAFRDLLADVRSILGAVTKLSYAADWSEYFGHHPADGSGDVFFHLDPLWADPDTDFVGIDNYMPLSDWRDGVRAPRRRSQRTGDLRPRLPAGQHRRRRGLRLVLRDRRGSQGAGPHPDHRRRPRETVGLPHQGPARLVGEPARQSPGRHRGRRANGLGPAVEADRLHRGRLPGGRPWHESAERLLRPEIVGELPAALLPRLARRRHPAGLHRGDLGLVGRRRQQPDLLGLWRPHGARRRLRRLDLGRAALSVLPRARRRLDRRAELAARALADRPPRGGVARRAGARPLPPRRFGR
jgi:hypothetical protein